MELREEGQINVLENLRMNVYFLCWLLPNGIQAIELPDKVTDQDVVCFRLAIPITATPRMRPIEIASQGKPGIPGPLVPGPYVMIVELRVVTEVAVVTIVELVVAKTDVAVLDVDVTVAVTVAILVLTCAGKLAGLATTTPKDTRKAVMMNIDISRYRFLEGPTLNFKSFTPRISLIFS